MQSDATAMPVEAAPAPQVEPFNGWLWCIGCFPFFLFAHSALLTCFCRETIPLQSGGMALDALILARSIYGSIWQPRSNDWKVPRLSIRGRAVYVSTSSSLYYSAAVPQMVAVNLKFPLAIHEKAHLTLFGAGELL